MRAEVIATGDEIVSGRIVDTNTCWLSQRLEELGLRVLYHSAVPDEMPLLVEAFRQAIGRSDVAVITGGLGPTAADLTREALAAATGRRLVFDGSALQHIRELFARRKRPMPPQNERQALFPEGSRVVPNPHGTAPGIALEVPRQGRGLCRLFALPGVPAEMEEMWPAVAECLGRSGSGRRIIRHRQIKCFGAGESQIEAMLPDLIRRGRTPRVGINASQTTIILRVAAEGADENECEAAMAPTVATIYQCLGDLIFGEGSDELQDVVVRLLDRQGKSLATAEWGTAGLVAAWLGDVPQADRRYLGGMVTSSFTAACQVLGLPEQVLAQRPEGDRQLAEAMARSCRSRFSADLGLSVGRFPQIDPGQDAPPVFFALADARGVTVKAIPLGGHPATLKVYGAKHALNLVRLALMHQDASAGRTS